MASLRLQNLHKTFNGNVHVIRGIVLELVAREFMVFVGPSGCGKSTTLRMIAGLEEISGGTLSIGERAVNNVPPSKRGVAMVFQSYALYPHMTVAENMGFALKLEGKSKSETSAAVDRAAEILQITHLLARKPKALSGGQRQRVAIGRCIVRQPEVFLFDEPLSNLDAALRVQMRIELARLHRELGATMIYVTHDQVEAMTLGDRIAVFNHGIIEQVGTPLELYHRPANRFVAGFIGSPSMNFLPVVWQRHAVDASLRLPGGASWTMRGGATRVRARDGEILTLGLRPEHLTLDAADDVDGISAKVEMVEYLGGEQLVHALSAADATQRIIIKLAADAPLAKEGDSVTIRIDPQRIHLFDAQDKSLLS